MKKLNTYTVKLQRTVEHTAHVEHVQAATMDEAIEKAIKIADQPCANLWREGDCIGESSKAVKQPSCKFCGRGVGFGHTTCGPCSDVP